jgi:hypothetical protein
LCGGRDASDFSSLRGVDIVHCLSEVFFGLSFVSEAFFPQLDVLVSPLVSVQRFTVWSGVLIEVLGHVSTLTDWVDCYITVHATHFCFLLAERDGFS